MIKRMTSNNMEQAIELYLEVFKLEPFSYGWLKRNKVVRYFEDNEKTPGGYSMIYYHEASSKPCGLCMGVVMDYFVLPTYDIKEFVVRRDVQGCGMGTRMMDEVAGHLLERGVEVITLTTQRDIPAYNFYKKNNFEDLDKTVFMSRSTKIP